MFRFALALVLLGFLPGVALAFVTAGAGLIQDTSILWPVVAGHSCRTGDGWRDARRARDIRF